MIFNLINTVNNYLLPLNLVCYLVLFFQCKWGGVKEARIGGFSGGVMK